MNGRMRPMVDPDQPPSELDRLIRAAASGVGSGVRGIVLFIGTGMLCLGIIGQIEHLFYDIPYIALGLWLITGVFIFRACDQGHL